MLFQCDNENLKCEIVLTYKGEKCIQTIDSF